MLDNNELEKKEIELFKKIGVFTVGHPTFEQAKFMEDFMHDNCKWCEIKHFDEYLCNLAETKCDSLPSKCIYRKIYAKAVDDIKKKLESFVRPL